MIDIFHKPLEHLEQLRDIASPVVALQPRATGGIPMNGLPDGPNERRLDVLVYLMLAAWYRTLFWRYMAEAPPGEQADAFPVQERQRQLDAAREGNTDGLYNLGLMSARAGRDLASRVWWRLAATEGDTESMRSLGLSYAAIGRHDAARFWLDSSWDQGRHAPPVPLSGARLVELGQAVDDADSLAADECFRRSLYGDSVLRCLPVRQPRGGSRSRRGPVLPRLRGGSRGCQRSPGQRLCPRRGCPGPGAP